MLWYYNTKQPNNLRLVILILCSNYKEIDLDSYIKNASAVFITTPDDKHYLEA